jgi:pSer/pThr/pTyr-binding forkhead associated (FHA) protein
MDEFDFYHRWLGIPPEEQPPSHYRLLGLPLFEEDLEVIANCADRQRSYVKRQSANVKKFEASGQKILNEIESARICLMNAEKRQSYNEKLRSRLLDNQKTKPVVSDDHVEKSSPFFVGSIKSCDLVIESRAVSSVHCSIVKNGNRVILRDLKSTNGTTVNLNKITKPTEIFPSDLILLAKSYRLKLPDSIFRNIKPTRGFAFLGRSSQCEITIDSASISLFHARCVFDAHNITVEDLKSTNGTFLVGLDGRRERLPPLQPTSITGTEGIRLGKHHISLAKLLSDLDRTKASSSDGYP